MGRSSAIPAELKRGPVTIAAALAAGVPVHRLRSRRWLRLSRGVYIWRSLARDHEVRLRAALERVPDTAVFSGYTAAWLHGLDVSPLPVELTLPDCGGVSARTGLALRRRVVRPEDVVTAGGYRFTSIGRTLCDLGHRLSIAEAVVLLDSALHLRLIDPREMRAWSEEHPGTIGIRELRRAIELADGRSESPMETRLRMLLVLNGLPPPELQVEVRDAAGRLLGRPDLFYPDLRLGIEYDGGTHRDSLAEDDRRQNRLLAAGVTLLRYTAGDIRDRPLAIVDEVGRHLRRRRISPAV